MASEQERLAEMLAGHTRVMVSRPSGRKNEFITHENQCACGLVLPWTEEDWRLALLLHHIALILDSDVIRERDAENERRGAERGWGEGVRKGAGRGLPVRSAARVGQPPTGITGASAGMGVRYERDRLPHL